MFSRGPPDDEPNLEEKDDGCQDEICNVGGDIRKSNILILWLSKTVTIMAGLEAKSSSIIKVPWMWENKI